MQPARKLAGDYSIYLPCPRRSLALIRFQRTGFQHDLLVHFIIILWRQRVG
jgi:hypothetical protein